ncbi:hypothetical protein [Methylobacterium sp. ARG-1]|uniref:hypothetical protein n=1 Tax=Methylobacterium sp. ARG-1 TaxID=1692501 RepID=UPI0006822688|nr:hypothetical protein [Methylobacterium sp. ARG-1]KNY23802.1 hypothetical protein AKJ13_04795 [Methylobacterium sp. ARG-1]
MVRFASIVAAAGALAACGPAWAAPEITLAAIATGRLYVVGTTDRPHMPVVLEDKFRTESDDKGKFQYELVYHPARCIVAATIDGKAVEAVVSNCGQQCAVAPPNAAAPLPAMPGRAGLPAAAGPPTRAPQNRAHAATPPDRPGATSEPAAPAPAGPAAGAPRKVQIERPPRPPQRPATQAPPQARAVQPAKPARKPRPSPREAPDEAGPPIAD